MCVHLAFGTRHSALHRGFTLVELLVVIGIIALLASILFPVVGKVREAARETDTRAFIVSIESACQSYKQDMGAYPGPLSSAQITALTQPPIFPLTGSTAINTATVSGTGVVTAGPGTGRITESENAVLGLVGGLVVDRTTTPATLRFDPTTVGSGAASLNPARALRGTLYMQVGNLSKSDAPFTDEGTTTSSMDTVIPEFLDRWPQGMPILILRARVGGHGDATAGTYSNTNNDVVVNVPFDANNQTNGALLGQYNLVEITPYTQSQIGSPRGMKPSDYVPAFDPMKPHGLASVDITKVLAKGGTTYSNPYDAFPYLTDPSSYDTTKTSAYTAAEIKKMKARKADTIILISAGRDRVYGTSDDVTNFGSVLP